MNKDDGISPVRVSKLKKRRRGGRESLGSNACGLQNLGSSPKQNRQSNVTTAATNGISTSRGDGYCKENLLNSNPTLSGRQSMPIQGDNVNIDKNDGACDNMHQSTKIDKDLSSLSPTNYKSTLGFIDDIDQCKLISALPSMLGIDSDEYKTNSKDFQQCLERSFEYTNINNRSNKLNDKDAGVYHPLVGRMDPHPTKSSTNITISDEKDKLSFAFPQCTDSSEKNTTNEEEVNPYDIFQHLNLVRRSEHGMTLPASWYQFPQSKTKISSSPSSVIMAASVNEKVSTTTNMEQMKKQPVIEKS